MSMWGWDQKIERTPVLSERQVKEIREEAEAGRWRVDAGCVIRLCDTILHWQAEWSEAYRMHEGAIKVGALRE